MLPSAYSEGAKEGGVRHTSILTAVGANEAANITSLWAKIAGTASYGPFVQKVKGTIENNLHALEFESLAAYRPAGLIGKSNAHS